MNSNHQLHLIVCLLFFVFSSQAQNPIQDSIPDGNCFVRTVSKDIYTFENVQILVKPAYARIQVVPAVFETVVDSVLVKPASGGIDSIPAEYKIVSSQVLIQPASTVSTTIPAQYETYQKKVLAQKGGQTVWKPIDCGFKPYYDENLSEINALNSQISSLEQKLKRTGQSVISEQERLEFSAYASYLKLKRRIRQREVDELLDKVEDCRHKIKPINSPVAYISNPVSSENIKIEWKATPSDGVNSNLKLKTVVSKGFALGLEKANKMLRAANLKPIKDITISSTANGCHGKGTLSNHYSHLAIDINYFDGIHVSTYVESKRAYDEWVLLKKQLSEEDKQNKFFWKKIDIIHKAFSESKYTRENFGPVYVKKMQRGKDITETNYDASDIKRILAGHWNHVHFSFL